MSRRKKNEGETEEQATERRLFEAVANTANRSDKTSWNRKMDNMVKILARLRPIEQQILDLQAEKMPIMDEISDLRATMVNECVHPYEFLVNMEDHVLCKFCNKRISKPSGC